MLTFAETKKENPFVKLNKRSKQKEIRRLKKQKMGDYYGTIVPQKVKKSDIELISEKIVKYLSDNKIIKLSKKENVFSSENNHLGFEPDINYHKAVHIYDNRTPSLVTNGVVIELGRRSFYSTNVETVECSNCGLNIWENDAFVDKIKEWENETGDGIITCEECGETNSITEYNFLPEESWAFGEIGITFWNWGEFQDSFIKELENLIDYKISIVFGKL